MGLLNWGVSFIMRLQVGRVEEFGPARGLFPDVLWAVGRSSLPEILLLKGEANVWDCSLSGKEDRPADSC